MLSLGLCECPRHLAGYLATAFHAQSLHVPSAPSTASRCCQFETVLWSSCFFIQPLLLCLASVLGLCTCSFPFLHSLPLWFVTLPEDLSL